jgi:hypothetical protein
VSEIGFEEGFDFLAEVDEELAEARERAVRAVDRADALARLREYVQELEDELKRPVRASEVFDTRDEVRRARLAALTDRITEGEES